MREGTCAVQLGSDQEKIVAFYDKYAA